MLDALFLHTTNRATDRASQEGAARARIPTPPQVSATSGFQIGGLSPAAFPHAVTRFRVDRDPLSWLALTGSFAYRIKKPVRNDLLDASTLARRVNRARRSRGSIGGSPRTSTSTCFPYARGRAGEDRGAGSAAGVCGPHARVRSVARTRRRSSRPAESRLSDVRSLEPEIAELHRHAARAPEPVGRRPHPGPDRRQPRGARAVPLVVRGYRRHSPTRSLASSLTRRSRPPPALGKREGAVRERHGDPHAHNIVRWRQRWTPFDWIEFNPDPRWIDVLSDVAFSSWIRGRWSRDPAYGFLSRYPEDTGDYEGLRVLSLYADYRALFRARSMRSGRDPLQRTAHGHCASGRRDACVWAATSSALGPRHC